MTPVIEAVGLTKRFGTHHRPRRPRPERPRGRGPRLPRPQRVGQVHDDPGPAGPAARRRRHGDPARRRPVARRRRAAPPARLRPRRRGPLAQPHRRRGHRPARAAARRARPGQARQAARAFELDPTKKGRSYSKGNRQKVALVAALASDAPLLLLDEPTSGLDPLMEKVFREHLRQVRAEGRTVLLSSHILSEVEAAADRVSIVRAGRVVDSGTLADLRHLTRSSIVATLARPVSPSEATTWPGRRRTPARTANDSPVGRDQRRRRRAASARPATASRHSPASHPRSRSSSSRSTASRLDDRAGEEGSA